MEAITPQEELYQLIRSHFKPAEKNEVRIKGLIAEYLPIPGKLNRSSMLMIMKHIRKDFKREDWPEVKYMFKAIFVFIVSQYKPHLHMKDVSDLMKRYPEFEEADEVEKSLLLQFRNLFTIACEIIEPKNHKGELIALVGRMTGAIYVTGGGQTTATDRRVLLYERETGIAPRKQPDRKRRSDDPATVSLAALHNEHRHGDIHIPGVNNNSAQKRVRYDAPDTKTLLRSADSFWNYHRALMEAGDDIPYKTVPAEQAFSSYAYPSHDLGYPTAPHGLVSALSHPSMRHLVDTRHMHPPQDPRMNHPDPRMNQQDPRMSLPDPRMSQQDPRMNHPDPRMSLPDPRMNLPDPRMSYPDPRMMRHDPHLGGVVPMHAMPPRPVPITLQPMGGNRMVGSEGPLSEEASAPKQPEPVQSHPHVHNQSQLSEMQKGGQNTSASSGGPPPQMLPPSQMQMQHQQHQQQPHLVGYDYPGYGAPPGPGPPHGMYYGGGGGGGYYGGVNSMQMGHPAQGYAHQFNNSAHFSGHSNNAHFSAHHSVQNQA